jgi:glycerol-1-phosphate dehydrogenase [NAD(P)+]
MFINFPLEFQIFNEFEELTYALNLFLQKKSKKFIVISGKTHSLEYTHSLLRKIDPEPETVYRLENNDIAELYSLEKLIRKISPTHILAVGGGKVGDFGKRISLVANIPLILIPTVISNDGLISPVAVLNEDGRSISLPGRMPEAVLIGLECVRSAPNKYIHAAACDLATNISATNDWSNRDVSIQDKYNLGLHLSQIAASNVLNCYKWDLNDETFLRSIISGQILSGIAMALAGSSRPCSGSEHLISHAMDYLKIGEDILHGAKVAACSRFCLNLQGYENKRLQDFFDVFRIPRIFPGTENYSLRELNELFDLAKKMRPGRATVLDKYSGDDLTSKYLRYQSNERKVT